MYKKVQKYKKYKLIQIVQYIQKKIIKDTKHYWNWYVTKNYLLKIEYHQNRNITKTEMWPKLKINKTEARLYNWTFKVNTSMDLTQVRPGQEAGKDQDEDFPCGPVIPIIVLKKNFGCVIKMAQKKSSSQSHWWLQRCDHGGNLSKP